MEIAECGLTINGEFMEELNILHEDNHIIVVLKPQNVPTCEDSSKDKDLLTMVKE